MAIAEFDLDGLLAKVEKILKKTKPKPPDPTTIVLCEVIASLVVEVARLRGELGRGNQTTGQTTDRTTDQTTKVER